MKNAAFTTQSIVRSNLAKQITDVLRREIMAHYKPGQIMPPIMEMAKGFGVSYQTVRESLSVLETQGLVERRSGSGTYVCDWNAGRHVAVWCERDIFDPHASYFYRYVPRQLVRFFQAQGFSAKLYVGDVSHAEPPRADLTCTEFAQALDSHQIRGVLALDEPTGSGWLELLRGKDIPVVRSREINEPSGSCCPLIYDPRKSQMGAEYLLRHGRRRIALMQWLEPRLPGVPRSDPVLDSFQKALAAAGAAVNQSWIRNDLPPGAPGAGWEEFREIWASSREKPDGLVVCDDVLFLGAAMAICQLGIRVPEDLLVVTHFNKGSGLTSPFPIVKLQVDPNEFVQEFGQMLLSRIQGEAAESSEVNIEIVETDRATAAAPDDKGIDRAGAPAGIRRPRKAQKV